MSRAKARQTLNIDSEKSKLKKIGVIHNMNSTIDLDEAPSAYKDIEDVMRLQQDLVSVEFELTPMVVLKDHGKKDYKKQR